MDNFSAFQNDNFSSHIIPNEQEIEISLRPNELDEFIGQSKVRKQLSLILQAAQKRGTAPDHILFSGPPGLGKTSLAMIVAKEIGVGIKITSGPALERAGDLASMLSNLQPGEIFFIDEIHRIPRPVEEMLYLAMEDFRVDIVVGKGPGATSIPLELVPFTLVGATTRTGALTGPLRDRFGFAAHLDFYSPHELAEIIIRAAKLLGISINKASALELGTRSRGTPRIANRLLRRIRDYSQVKEIDYIDVPVVTEALKVYEVDDLGLDKLDRKVLEFIIGRFNGGPVGINTIALSVGETPHTIEEVCEPFLLRLGLLERTSRGRVALPAAWKHLGIKYPKTTNKNDQVLFE